MVPQLLSYFIDVLDQAPNWYAVQVSDTTMMPWKTTAG